MTCKGVLWSSARAAHLTTSRPAGRTTRTAWSRWRRWFLPDKGSVSRLRNFPGGSEAPKGLASPPVSAPGPEPLNSFQKEISLRQLRFINSWPPPFGAAMVPAMTGWPISAIYQVFPLLIKLCPLFLAFVNFTELHISHLYYKQII